MRTWTCLAMVLCVANSVQASPMSCHCSNGQVGVSCPMQMPLNCPTCPPQQPCNPFTLPTLPPDLARGIAQMTLPTLAPFPGFTPPTTTSAPLPAPAAYIPSSDSQPQDNGLQQYSNTAAQYDSLVQFQTFPPAQYQQYQPAPQVQHAQLPQHHFQEPAVQVQPSVLYAEIPTTPSTVDATTQTSTLPSESYVELEDPEGRIFESEPNKGFRKPIRKALAANTQTQTPLTEKCNDERLRRIIEENVDENPSSSKRKIQKAASDEIGGLFDVVCSAHDFSYLANTQLFCESGNDDVTCFVFLHSVIQ